MEEEKVMHRKYRKVKAALFVLAGIVLMTGCGTGTVGDRDTEKDSRANTAEPETIRDRKAESARSKTAETTGTMREETKAVEQDKIDYPFPDSMKNWKLVLCTEQTAGKGNDFLFRLYDEEKELVQEFSCEIEAEELAFRFDRDLYDPWAGLAVYPADAELSHTDGLLFSFDYDTDRFVEEPIEIPWYDEVIGYHTLLVTDRQENVETKTIYSLDKEIRQPIKLRTWTLSWDGEESGTARLHIEDYIEEAVLYDGILYDGEEGWKALGKLADDDYFQDLFFHDLHYPWRPSIDDKIATAKYVIDEDGGWDLENLEYESKEALLEDCGFQDAEPFYQYYDDFGNIVLELYYDESAGKGCGFRNSHAFNYESGKVFWCDGFIFEGTSAHKWEDDTYSLLIWGEQDAREEEDVTQVLYKYTDDGKIVSYEVRGLTEDTELRFDEGMEVSDDFLVSIDWIYRSDGTLYRKYYYHNPRVYGTSGQSQETRYDELGRAIYSYEYITHGFIEYYYIYDGDNMQPKYCLSLDQNMGYSVPDMIIYK